MESSSISSIYSAASVEYSAMDKSYIGEHVSADRINPESKLALHLFTAAPIHSIAIASQRRRAVGRTYDILSCVSPRKERMIGSLS